MLLLSRSMTVLAVSEADVEAVGKEAASGNLLIWFLCAIAFLKVSQKIDSFMGSLGVNVGHTGGSMLAEMLIAARGITTVKNISGGRKFPWRFLSRRRKHQQHKQCLLFIRGPGRCCGTPVCPERHADHDRTVQQSHQQAGI